MDLNQTETTRSCAHTKQEELLLINNSPVCDAMRVERIAERQRREFAKILERRWSFSPEESILRNRPIPTQEIRRYLETLTNESVSEDSRRMLAKW